MGAIEVELVEVFGQVPTKGGDLRSQGAGEGRAPAFLEDRQLSALDAAVGVRIAGLDPPLASARGFDCLAKGGKLVIVGLFGGGATFPLPLIPIKAITIQGSYVGNLRETAELLDLVRNKMIAPIPVTTMPLAQANQALVDLQKGKLVGRAVLTP